jgi:hypothetical protein
VLGEFFVAPLADIDDAVLEGGPMNRFETVEAKTVSSVSIAMLGEVLGIGTYDDVFDLVDQGRFADHGEAGIDVVPTRCATLLRRRPIPRASPSSGTTLTRCATGAQRKSWKSSRRLLRWPAVQVQQIQLWFWWSL